MYSGDYPSAVPKRPCPHEDPYQNEALKRPRQHQAEQYSLQYDYNASVGEYSFETTSFLEGLPPLGESMLPPANLQSSIPSNTYEDQDTTVCLGMMTGIRGKCERKTLYETTFPVTLDGSEKFYSNIPNGTRGLILPQYGQMIQGLLEESTLTLFVSCSLDADISKKPVRTASLQSPCLLEITVYGPFDIFDQLGDWLQDYDVYLQDPRACHLDVKYCNPHRLSAGDPACCPLLSEVVSKIASFVHLQQIADKPELLDILGGQEDLEEALQPTLIRAGLHRHQKQALTFMIRREKGWSFTEDEPDIWEAVDTTHGQYFINRISHTQHAEPPPPFSGGIVADSMGLGKTLTMIALVANDFDGYPVLSGDGMLVESPEKRFVTATLIVVPQPLLDTWEDQIAQHSVAGSLAVYRHHAKSRLTDINELDAVNVVLTTYHTLAADWKASGASEKHIIFSVRWNRIILDEAHVIRNMKSRLARAVCDLDANSRWAVTGTPIQNHLGDLAALFKFIRAHPYDDPKRFDTDLSRPWKSGEDEEAVKRLKCLSKCLILRRAKQTINLPPRHDLVCAVNFSNDERALYDMMRLQTITRMDDALLRDSDISTSGIYINLLQQIESLRLVCNLGLHYHTRHEAPLTREATDWATVAQATFNIQRDMDSIACSQCSEMLEMTETFSDEHILQYSSHFSRCLKYACADCCHRLRIAGKKMVCGHTPRCPIAPISINYTALEETLSHGDGQVKPSSVGLPSKVETLISDLKTLPSDVKCIVFSTWRLTLDIVEQALNQAGIRSVRFDGKVSHAQRQHVLSSFRSDPSIRIILLTLACGAVGLTLTEASRAYLMEPHWNPTIEEQALARIHRIGQRREVTTVRFYMRDSFEERVMEVQESKKNLAGVLLSGHDGNHADDSLGALQRLRSLL